MFSQVKLHSSNFGSRLATFQDFMDNPVLTFNELMKLLRNWMWCLRKFAFTSCAHNVMVDPRVLLVVTHIFDAVYSIWECLGLLNLYHNVVEVAETTGDAR